MKSIENSPFPLNSTYRYLENRLLVETGKKAQVEVELENLIRTHQIDADFQEEYFIEGGYCKDIFDTSVIEKRIGFTNYLAIPLSIALDNNKGITMNYREAFEHTDWSIFEQSLNEYLPGIKVQNLSSIQASDTLTSIDFPLFSQLYKTKYGLA